MNKPAIGSLANWFGTNRTLGGYVGQALIGCVWVGIPMCGGLSEVPHIAARTIACNDAHRHLINLATVAAHPQHGPLLYRRLRRVPFHPEALAAAQARCRKLEEARVEEAAQPLLFGAAGDGALATYGLTPHEQLQWAADYFMASWLARAGAAGTKGEFAAPLATRYTAGGGDSAVRFANATRALVAWRRVLRRCAFTCVDAFAALAKYKDEREVGVYVDPPFPGPGDAYKCGLGPNGHQVLAEALRGFKAARVVCRYYDHPTVRELYQPAHGWVWYHVPGGKTQTGGAAPEVLLVRNGPRLAVEELSDALR